MSTAEIPPSESTSGQIRTGLNRVVRDTLRPAAVVLVIAYAGFSIANPFILPAESRTVMTGMAVSTLLAALGILAFVFRREIAPRHAHAWAGLMLGLVAVNLAVHICLTPEPALAGNLLVLIIASGCFVLSHGWMATAILVSLGIWFGGVILNPAADWWSTAHLVAVSAMIAVFVYLIRFRTYSRYEQVKLQLEQTAERLEHRLQFEQILTQISTRFLDLTAEEIDAGIEQAIGAVGECLAIDRACVCRAEGSPLALSLIHEWCGPEVSPRKIPFPKIATSDLPWCWQTLEADQNVQIVRLVELGKDAEADRTFLERNGIRSFFAVPLSRAGRTWGLLALAAERAEVVWSDDTCSLLKVLGEIIVASVQRKEAEVEISNLNLRLQQASRLVGLGEMAANLAHDLTNGLSAVSLQTSGAGRKAAKGKLTLEKCQEYIADIAEQTERLSKLLVAIQKFSREPKRERRPFEFGQVLDDAELLVSGKLRQKLIKLERAEPGGAVPILGDPSQITLVAVNLILNAAQAMSRTEPAKRRITICVENDDPEFLEVAIRDEGDGVETDLLDKIFDKFYTTKKDGLGLGLAFSRSYIEQHGGKLWCDSQPGQGSTFRFTLPKAEKGERGA